MTFKAIAILGAALVLASCGAPKPRPAPVPPGVAPAARPPAGASLYRIDSQQSEIRLLVYKAGPMARLGHNHVIVNRAVRGWVSGPLAAGGSFSLEIPAAGFVVDEREARAAEGADFAQDVGEEAKSGTLHNMLSEALLDADHHPVITVASAAVSQLPNALAADMVVTVAGHESRITVPFSLGLGEGVLEASGSAVLRQSDLGLVPFSVMMGALKVQDELSVKFRLIARKD
jgi:hypothetical protein